MSRPALDHVAIGVPALAAAPAFVEGVLGGSPFEGGPGPGYQWRQWQFEGGGLLEVLEPDGPPGGFLHRFLERRGPGVHHVTFKVDSLVEACERARSCGCEVVGFNDAGPGWKEAFLHPRRAQGIVVQLAETAPLAEGSAWPDLGFAARVRSRPAPVRLLGVRLRARSRERAQAQWGELLGGELHERQGELHFHWPGSPLRIAVEVAATGEEGPVALELASARPLELPAGPHPQLGARFVCVRGDAAD